MCAAMCLTTERYVSWVQRKPYDPRGGVSQLSQNSHPDSTLFTTGKPENAYPSSQRRNQEAVLFPTVVIELFGDPSDSRNLDYVPSLRSFCTLDDFEFNRIPLVQRSVPLTNDCGVMDKNIGAIIASDESISFCIIVPFDLTSHSSSSPGT
jgi:hypothetical protein